MPVFLLQKEQNALSMCPGIDPAFDLSYERVPRVVLEAWKARGGCTTLPSTIEYNNDARALQTHGTSP